MPRLPDAKSVEPDVQDPAELGIAVRAGAGRVRVMLQGELDLAGVSDLAGVVDLVRRMQLPFTLECVDLTFIDCAGVGVLVRAVRFGGSLDGIRGQVRRVVDLLGLGAAFGLPVPTSPPSADR